MSNDFDPELLRFYSKTKLRELQKSTELTLKQKYELIKVTSPIDENTHEYKIVGNGFVVRKKPASKITQTAPSADGATKLRSEVTSQKDAPKEEPKEARDPPQEKQNEKLPEEIPKADPFQDLKKYLN